MTRIGRWAACHAVALCEGGFGVGRWMFSASLQLAIALHLISQPLLVAMRPHPFAALVLRNFCFPSFFKRAHSDSQSSQVAIQPFNARYCNCISFPYLRLQRFVTLTDVTRIAFQRRARKQSNL